MHCNEILTRVCNASLNKRECAVYQFERGTPDLVITRSINIFKEKGYTVAAIDSLTLSIYGW